MDQRFRSYGGLISAHFDSPAIQQANELVEKADAIIVASPVYKASYTGVLKTYLDLLPQKGLAQKVFPTRYKGGLGGSTVSGGQLDSLAIVEPLAMVTERIHFISAVLPSSAACNDG